MESKFTQRNIAAGQPPKKNSSGTTLMSYSSNKALLDSKSAGKVLRTATPAETKKKLDMLKTGKYQVDLNTGKLYPTKSESKQSYTATKTTINRPPAKKAVAAKVVAPAKVVTPTKPAVKKEGMVDVNKYIERLPGGEIREIKYGEYKTLSGTGRNVQTFTPAQFEKIKNRL